MSRNNTLAIVQLHPFLSLFLTLPCSIVLDLNFQVLDSAQSLIHIYFLHLSLAQLLYLNLQLLVLISLLSLLKNISRAALQHKKRPNINSRA
jgi:hypothetical protein